MTNPEDPDETQPPSFSVPPVPEDSPPPPVPPTPDFTPPSAPDFPPPPAASNDSAPTPPPSNYPAPPPSNYPAPPPPPGYGYGQVQPGNIPPGMYVDATSGLLLPNGTELASSGRRIGAFFLSIPLSIVTLGIGYIIWGLVVWGRGQTPALQVLGMRVWRPTDQKPAGFGWMALREIVGRFVEGVLSIVTEIISFVMMLTGKERKTLHDLIASTVVLYDPNKVLASK